MLLKQIRIPRTGAAATASASADGGFGTAGGWNLAC